jgi:membrane protein DedA with SNARE-associated domain
LPLLSTILTVTAWPSAPDSVPLMAKPALASLPLTMSSPAMVLIAIVGAVVSTAVSYKKITQPTKPNV